MVPLARAFSQDKAPRGRVTAILSSIHPSDLNRLWAGDFRCIVTRYIMLAAANHLSARVI